MQERLHTIGVLLFSIFILGGCAKEGCTDPTATNYNSKATKNDGTCKYANVLCNATNYNGSGSCSSQYVAVSSTSCCPKDYPYVCSNTNKCYATCEDAQIVCNYPTKGISQTGGGGSAGYNCNGSSCFSVSSGASYSTLSACQSSCGGGGSAGYVCSGGTCSYVSSGASYTSLSSCQSNCSSSSAGYVCSGGTCSYVSSGASYTSLSSCQSSCGGGGSSQVVFYTTQSQYGQIIVYVNNTQRGTITQYYSGAPSCGASGCVTVTVTGQNNTWYAENTAGTLTWTGSIQLPNSCNPVQLN